MKYRSYRCQFMLDAEKNVQCEQLAEMPVCFGEQKIHTCRTHAAVLKAARTQVLQSLVEQMEARNAEA